MCIRDSSQADTIKFYFSFAGDAPTLDTPILVIGGTGAYAGVSGTAKFTNLTFVTQSTTTFTMTGSITQPSSTTPLISVVGTANYGLNRIAQNAWTAIKGTHLVPATTPAGGVFWSNAPE